MNAYELLILPGSKSGEEQFMLLLLTDYQFPLLGFPPEDIYSRAQIYKNFVQSGVSHAQKAVDCVPDILL